MRKNLQSYRVLFFLIPVFLFVGNTSGQNQPSPFLRLNQIGFYPNERKIAVIAATGYTDFFIATDDDGEKVFSGKLSAPRKSAYSEKQTQIADFSSLNRKGKYKMVVPGLGSSYTFEIQNHIFYEVSKASLKAFYFQRFSTGLTEAYAGKWSRPFSHADDKVLVHGSAASRERPEGSILSSPRGWIDAGDYNKYIVNSGITMGTLLSAYEDFPDYFQQLDLNIPESKNEMPDLLDEVLWNLRWMLTMQDPRDGGVYHKCTNAQFDPMVMPHKATTNRYVVQKGTAATLDFAAVTAQAARIFKKYGRNLPGLSDSCLTASKLAWNWALKNPSLVYDQDKINKEFEPDVVTGGYGDSDFRDEFIWAASELAVSTGNEDYLKSINLFPDNRNPVPTWNQVQFLGYYTLVRFEKQTSKVKFIDVGKIKIRIKQLADELINGVDTRAYHTVMGGHVNDFVWGSNAVASNQGIALIYAYKISDDKKYLRHAIDNLDYLLGRNATGYSFLTGYGDKQVMHPHHRPSEADGIEDPIPGLLVGGPNPGMQDKCSYPSSLPDEAFVDDVCSYASNEIAVNWNAPFVYLAGAIEALQNSAKK